MNSDDEQIYSLRLIQTSEVGSVKVKDKRLQIIRVIGIKKTQMDITFSRKPGTVNSLDDVLTSSEDLFQEMTDPQKIIKHITGSLRWIMFTMQQEQRAYQEQVNQYFRDIHYHFQMKIDDQNRIINDLRTTVDTLIEASKMADSQFDKIIKAKDDQIEIYKNLLRRRYVQDFEKSGQIKRTPSKLQPTELNQPPNTLRKVVSSSNFAIRTPQAPSPQPQKILYPSKHTLPKNLSKLRLLKQYLGPDPNSELLSACRQTIKTPSKPSQLTKANSSKQSSTIEPSDSRVSAIKQQINSKVRLALRLRQRTNPGL